MRKYKDRIRCIKNWDIEETGWWAWSDFLQSWQYIDGSKISWLLDFLPAKPSVEDLLAEAYLDVVFNPSTEKLVFLDRVFDGSFDRPVFTEEELLENER
jgi:hypothetical protein